MAGSGGAPAGDVLISVEFASDSLFRADGDDVRLDLPVTLYEAVLGAKIRIPTLDGNVNVTVPPGTSSGQSLRLKGRGLPKKSGGRGDLFAQVRIMLPDSGDSGLESLMRDWKDVKPYDVRGSEFK